MTESNSKGSERERELARSSYFSDAYFALPALLSQTTQIREIYELKPSSILEIGPGNGFVSGFLRRAGIEVVTVDINPELEPDICAPLSELPSRIDRKFDLVVCCEVLEHMPLSELDLNIDILRATGRRLFMTLPNAFVSIGFGALVRLPRIGRFLVDAHINLPIKHNLEGSPHFWEVGYTPDCTRRNIMSRLEKRYKNVRSSRFALNPYHYSFIAE